MLAHRSTRLSLRFALGLALLLPLVACQKKGATTSDAATGPIRVGVFMDLTGQTSSFGQSTVNAIRLAVDELNAAGGVGGRPFELVVEDDQGRPEQAATVVTKLVGESNVVAILGEVASSNSLAAAPIAQRAGIPMISPSSTNPKVTEVGDYIFRVCFIDPFQGSVMARFASTSLGARTAAILLDVNSDYSRGLNQYFTEAFTALGGKVVDTQSYAQTDRDFSGQLTAIKAKNPDVIYVPGYYTQAGVIARQARQLGIRVPLLGGDGWDAPQLFELGGEAVRGSFISNHYSADDPAPQIQTFVKAYQGRHGAVPDALAALGYDAMKILADAIERAGTTAPAALRDALAATSGFNAVTGTISIDEHRNPVKSAVILEVGDGKFNYRETIQPGSPGAAATEGAEASTEEMAAEAPAAEASDAAPAPAAGE